MPNLSGQLGTTLQVPLVSGPAGLSLDFPYQCIPQKKLLEGSQCDNESGVYTDPAERKEYWYVPATFFSLMAFTFNSLFLVVIAIFAIHQVTLKRKSAQMISVINTLTLTVVIVSTKCAKASMLKRTASREKSAFPAKKNSKIQRMPM